MLSSRYDMVVAIRSTHNSYGYLHKACTHEKDTEVARGTSNNGIRLRDDDGEYDHNTFYVYM